MRVITRLWIMRSLIGPLFVGEGHRHSLFLLFQRLLSHASGIRSTLFGRGEIMTGHEHAPHASGVLYQAASTLSQRESGISVTVMR